ncbi:GlcNAc-PI de-N-acetylase [Actinacidiphila rubida]|uniref:GlcNAc-PI de-N-acetylase n=1 Tax=Actinacidiphila rubida TaxID=310780 RepID=A0A1H8M6S4_9ACTN|nr:GlcNAc-PI de-N-acetylase [Actinacidiphila rubida]
MTAAGAALAGCGPSHPRPRTPAAPAVAQAYRTGDAPLVMQFLAHPDDDLYFMNPDTLHTLQSGVPLVSVYVTGGESTGVNHEPDGRHSHVHDLAAYSSARHQGLRQAYATMLGLPHFTPWHREVISLLPSSGGPYAEVDTLSNGRAHATLVFLQVSMHETGGWNASLPLMWDKPGITLRYVVAEGAPSPADQPAVWTHDSLVTALAGLLGHFRPTLIRTLDPDPDIQVHDATHPKNSDQPGFSDHRDHTATALFTWKAIRRWAATAAAGTSGAVGAVGADTAPGAGRGRAAALPAFRTAVYRGYYNQRWPFNLPPATVALKGRLLFQYGGDANWACGNPGGCGDYGQGRNQPLTNPKGWVRSTHRRYPGTPPSAVVGTPGRRISYEVLGSGVARRAETRPGVWGAPRDLGGGQLAPALSALPRPGGDAWLFALRFTEIEGHGGPNTRDVVLWRDGRWTSLGSPEHGDRCRRVGAPVALATADGRVHVFVRNAAKGLSTRVLDTTGWGPWQNLGGGEVQEGLAALTDRAGRVHVFAAGRDTIHHWAQTTPGGPVVARPGTGLPRPGDYPTAVPTPDGAIAVSYPRPASARTVQARISV